jgi:hypothetical protein
MNLNELYDECTADLSYRELTAFHSHLCGGLLQQIEGVPGTARKVGKRDAAATIERARTFAIRERVSA